VLQPVDQVVEIPVTHAEFAQSFEIFEGFSIDFIGHSGLITLWIH
jgi:hypothetical protein